MLWEELTAKEFGEARDKSHGTCLVPIGVIEKHGDHLPLGTDMYMARKLAEDVARIEPVVVFPYYFFGQIAEARHCPGTIAIKPSLMYELLEEICKEISRNGFKKIVILNGHGGNPSFLNYFIQSTLYKKNDYAVYCITGYLQPDDSSLDNKIKDIFGEDYFDYHAGSAETSEVLSVRPDLVKLEHADEAGFKAQHKLDHITATHTFTAMNWYSDFPVHQAGDPTKACIEAGELLCAAKAERVAKIVKIIKEDKVTRQLLDEFYSKVEK